MRCKMRIVPVLLFVISFNLLVWWNITLIYKKRWEIMIRWIHLHENVVMVFPCFSIANTFRDFRLVLSRNHSFFEYFCHYQNLRRHCSPDYSLSSLESSTPDANSIILSSSSPLSSHSNTSYFPFSSSFLNSSSSSPPYSLQSLK